MDMITVLHVGWHAGMPTMLRSVPALHYPSRSVQARAPQPLNMADWLDRASIVKDSIPYPSAQVCV